MPAVTGQTDPSFLTLPFPEAGLLNVDEFIDIEMARSKTP
jgi:hypothetical protein